MPHRVLHNRRSTMSALAVSHVYPLGSRLNERGRLEIGGCDTVDLAAQFGTPAYVYAEDDMRARARSFVEAFRARTEHFEIVYAGKAFPCTAAFRLFAEEGLSADVASGGELHLAVAAGLDPERIYMHGNNKSPAELDLAIETGVSHIVVDSFDEIERLRGRSQRVLLRVTPGLEPSTHEFIQTGQVDSKFGFQLDEVGRAVEACAAAGLELCGLHAHIGSQILDVEIFGRLGELLAGMGDWPLLNLGGGLGIAYTADEHPPSIEDYVEALLRHAPDGVTVLCEPGRALVGSAGVTLYRVGTIKRIPGVRTYVAVDGGMSDNLRPMLYGARYEADVADRWGAGELCTVAGMHCESGDVLIRDVELNDPRVGDVLVVELMGGIDPTRDYVLRALEAGRHVVTANKQLLSQHGEEVFDAARHGGGQLRFEGAVAGVVPAIRVMSETLAAAHIERVHGIVNGTTNYILTEMARTGASYEEALADAQRLGYAEADPTEDVTGKDAAAKMAIIARLAFNARLTIDQVAYEGIEHITVEDIDYAKELGLSLKLIGTAERLDGGISVRVHPAFLYGAHPLAAVNGSFNAVTIESPAITEITLSGPGAGGTQTASAVLGDVISAIIPPATLPSPPVEQPIATDIESAFYLSLDVADHSGVLAQVAQILGLQGVSVKSVLQKGMGEDARLAMVMHPVLESRFHAAVRLIGGLDFLRSKPRVIRVIEETFEAWARCGATASGCRW